MAASDSLCSEVSTIQATGAKNSSVITQASNAHPGPALIELSSLAFRRALGALRGVEGDGLVGGVGTVAAHRDISSLNRDEIVRRAKVATMIVPITTTTPAAAASPYSYLRNMVR